MDLPAAVWAIVHFKYYLYGRRFTLITDHQALVSAVNSNKSNKTYQSRLTRWIDRLLPFDFEIKHLSGSKMGLIHYISRHPVGKPQPPAYWDEHFVVALIDNFISCLEFQDSTIANIEMIKNPNGTQRTLQLNRNENFARSNSHAKATKFTVNSQSLENSHALSNSNILNQSSINKIQKKTSSSHQSNQPYFTTQPSAPIDTKMNRQLQTGMALPPFKRILRKCHSGQQTTLTIALTNFASFTETPEEPSQSTFSFSDVRYQVIPS